MLTTAAFGTQFEALTDRLRSAWSDLKDHDTFSHAYDILAKFVEDFAKAPAAAIAGKAQSVLRGTLFDEKGQFVLGAETMGKVRDMFLKLFVAQLKVRDHIPLSFAFYYSFPQAVCLRYLRSFA